MASLQYMLSVFLGFYLLKQMSCQHEHNVGKEKYDRLVLLNNASEHFVAEIFEHYASNKTSFIAFAEFQELLNRLHIGKPVPGSREESFGRSSSPKEREEGYHNHQHRHERRDARSVDAKHHNDSFTTSQQHGHMECLNGKELLKLHNIDQSKGIRRKDFVQLCPSLVYQAQSGACLEVTGVQPSGQSTFSGTSLQVWGYGMLSITVISLSSLFAIAIIPLMGKAIYKKVMSFLVALAVGTLSGDALLHLIPHAFLHDHSGASHQTAVWKAFVIIAGIYAFFLVESFMRVRSSRKHDHHRHSSGNHHHHHHDHQNTTKECETQLPSPCESQLRCRPGEPLIGSRLAGIHFCQSRDDVRSPITSEAMTVISNLGSLECDRTPRTQDGADVPLCGKNEEWNNIGSLESGRMTGNENRADDSLCDKNEEWNNNPERPDKARHSFSDPELASMMNDNTFVYDDIYNNKPCFHQDLPCPHKQRSESGSNITASENATLTSHRKEGHEAAHHHHHHHGDKVIDGSTSIATVAWMVIVGDGFHNFSDGLAVGAAFSSSLTNGLTTAIAVFCHELPHELGDFAILIKSGLTFKQALAYNMASAIISYVGLVMGIAIGNIGTSHAWVLALTAGMFLYISLVSMLPELCSYQADGGVSVFLSQNAGILTGVAIMITIALLE